ncbi:MAG: hypothetical protein AB1644_10965 [Candidatus Zixiibacteriota bacterium]
MKHHQLRPPVALLTAALFVVTVVVGQPGRSSAAPSNPLCGDASGDGQLNISDLLTMVNYIYKGGVLPNPADADMDGVQGVTLRDLLFLQDYLFDPCGRGQPVLTCAPLVPHDPPEVPGNCWEIPERIFTAGDTARNVTLRLRHTNPIIGFDVPLQIMVGPDVAVIDTVLFLPPYSFLQKGLVRLSASAVSISAFGCTMPAGISDVATIAIRISAAAYCRGLGAAYGDGGTTHPPILIESDYAMVKPYAGCDLDCCIGLTGNVDRSELEGPDISDLTLLTDWLFCGQFAPILPCPQEADINTDATVDITDLTDLVDFLFFLIDTPRPCL